MLRSYCHKFIDSAALLLMLCGVQTYCVNALWDGPQ